MTLAGAWTLLVVVGLQTQVSIPPSARNLDAQKLRPNDVVSVWVFDQPEMTCSVRLDTDGTIRMPILKDRVKAGGLAPAELEKALAEALRTEKILLHPAVTVTVTEYHLSPPISVVGAVKGPITFQVVGTTTLLDAVTRAGGPLAEAGPDILVSRHPGEPGGTTALVERVRLRSLIDTADPSANLTLEGGEEVRIPEARIFVFGNIKRPGSLPVNDDATVFKAIALSEGLLANTSKQAYILRKEAGAGSGAGSRNEIAVDLKNIMARKVPDVALRADDILYVPENAGRRNTLAIAKSVGGMALAVVASLVYLTVR